MITKKSGFGRVGAFVSAATAAAEGEADGAGGLWPLIFTVDYPMVFWGWLGFDNRKNVGQYRERSCSLADADDLGVLSTTFTGI